jgi:hypothetical protein
VERTKFLKRSFPQGRLEVSSSATARIKPCESYAEGFFEPFKKDNEQVEGASTMR